MDNNLQGALSQLNEVIEIITQQHIESLIYTIRGVQVMLDRDLAMLYHVETKYLNRQVKRNPTRFPEDFMFQLTNEELEAIKLQDLKCQNVTSSWGGARYLPFVFTEEGVGQLSGVLKSEIAALISVRIQRAFVAMRRLTSNTDDLLKCNFSTSKPKDTIGGRQKLPYAFTERGSSMLATLDYQKIVTVTDSFQTAL